MRLGLMGGTFDPIHNAHLFIAEEARVRMSLDEVIFIANGRPPHKKLYDVTPGADRAAMVELAVDSNPNFSVSYVELDRAGPSYAVDTLLFLSEIHPTAELYFITGFDAVAEILTWKRHEEVIRLCRFIAVARSGGVNGSSIDALPGSYRKRIDMLESPHLDISSTEIRERAAQGLPIRYLVPDEVAAYISAQRLYI
jgi:nicotinate-nucleotide adenylyltransferase